MVTQYEIATFTLLDKEPNPVPAGNKIRHPVFQPTVELRLVTHLSTAKETPPRGMPVDLAILPVERFLARMQ